MCGGEGVWKISVPSTQFFWEHKTALKTKILLKDLFLIHSPAPQKSEHSVASFSACGYQAHRLSLGCFQDQRGCFAEISLMQL